MKIASIQRAERVENEFTFTFTDTTGLRRTASMSPRAQDELLTALLSVPLAEIGRPQYPGPLVAGNVRLHESADGVLVLEVTLTPKSAVHIALPTPLPDRLRDLLTEDRSKWRDTKVQ